MKKKIFSKVDLSSVYHQIPVHPDDVCKTAILIEQGLLEYNYMPFGLQNVTSTFQRMTDNIFQDFECTFVYIDYILRYSDDGDSHSKHLDAVFWKLREYNLKISISKRIFGATDLDFKRRN